jgi:hypothetical protein
MEKIVALIIAFLCSIVASQEMKFTESTGEELTSSAPLVPLFGYKEVYVSFFTFLGEADEMKMVLKYEETDPARTYPVSFSILDESGSEIMIRDYMSRNSLSEISYQSLIENGIQNYFKKMTNGKLDLDIRILENPNHSKGVWEVENTRSYYETFLQPQYGIGESMYRGHMVKKLKECGVTEIQDIVAPQGTLNETVFLNFMAEPIKPLSNGRSLGGVAPGNDSYTWVGDAINQNIAILTHELAHTCFAIWDNGFDGAASNFRGYIDDIFMGRSGSQTGPYCLMHHNQVTFGPYSLYGIHSVHTQSLYHQGYFDSSDYEILEEVFSNYDEQNKATIKLKSVHDQLTANDMSEGVKRFVILPVGTDNNESKDIPAIGSMTEAQHFLIEYRNGKGHDNIACINESGNSKGVLISHIINSDAMSAYYYEPCIDIEVAAPYQKYWSNGEDLYRNPDSTSYRKYQDPPGSGNWVQVYDGIMNGTYYNGKECPDWLDDYNYNDYLPQGGMGAWPYTFGEHSLPTDFFNDTDRNKFTPTTRPSSCSWKMKDTHIGVYIDHIDYENDYADLRIYRNYWSLPLTEEYLAVNNDGKSVIGLNDYCYFAEDFSVGGGIQVVVGNGTDGVYATLLPGTDMIMYSNSLLMMANKAVLKLDNSNLTFQTDSKYQPIDKAEIALYDSDLIFQEGVIIDPIGSSFYSYEISINGNSSFSKPAFDFIGASKLNLNEGSKFTVKAGTNFNLSSLSEITLKNGSELIIEDGAFLNFAVGAKIIVEGDAKISGNLGQTYATFIVTENSRMTFENGTVKPMLSTAINAGINSEVRIGSYSRLIYGQNQLSVFSEGSKIVIERHGFLDANKAIFTGDMYWKGIVAEVGSEFSIEGASFTNAETAISGTPNSINITNCIFANCVNGINLVGSPDYIIQNNSLTGIDDGIGISITSSDGVFSRNKISHFNIGASFIMSSPAVSKCEFTYNRLHGILVSGHDALPQLINTEQNQVYRERNCLIEKNAYAGGSSLFPRSHIGIIPVGNIYMRNNDILASPSFLGISIAQAVSMNPQHILLDAQYNFWGAEQITEDYFFGHKDYTIDYEPYFSAPC